MAKKIKQNYINNADLLTALIEYKKVCAAAEEEGKPLPIVPDYIGKSFMQISKNLAKSRQFSGYTFREEMEMDGVINCLKYMNNFNADKYDKPFQYFTQIVWNSFLTRIAAEKKQLYISFKLSQELLALGETYDGGDEIKLSLNISADYINDYIEDYEDKLAAKKLAKEEKDAEKLALAANTEEE